MMEKWYELAEIAKDINFSGDSDALICQLENNGVYSMSSLYSVINFLGVQPLFIPAVWKLCVPPRIHIFLWLLGHNKLMTKSNLLKRHIDRGEDCLFCTCKEDMTHLFFECVVSSNIWSIVQNFYKKPVGNTYESVARLWVSNKKASSCKHSQCCCSLVHLEI